MSRTKEATWQWVSLFSNEISARFWWFLKLFSNHEMGKKMKKREKLKKDHHAWFRLVSIFFFLLNSPLFRLRICCTARMHPLTLCGKDNPQRPLWDQLRDWLAFFECSRFAKKTFDLNIVDEGDSQFKRLSKDHHLIILFSACTSKWPFDALVIVATAYVIWWNPVFWQSKGQLETHLVEGLHLAVLRYKRHLAILAFSKRSFVDGSSPPLEEASAWLNHRSNLMQGMSIRLASLRLR